MHVYLRRLPTSFYCRKDQPSITTVLSCLKSDVFLQDIPPSVLKGELEKSSCDTPEDDELWDQEELWNMLDEALLKSRIEL